MNLKNKKGQSMPINLIVVVILAAIMMIVLIVWFISSFNDKTDNLDKNVQVNKCDSSNILAGRWDKFEPVNTASDCRQKPGRVIPGINVRDGENPNRVCCAWNTN